MNDNEKNLHKNRQEKYKRLKREFEMRRIRVKSQWSNVIVNGDDMVFMTDRKFYNKYFCPTVTEMGLVPSRGKNYLSTYFCMINSQIFQIKGRKGEIKKLGYFNQKVLTSVDVKNPNSMGPSIFECIDTFNNMVVDAPWCQPSLQICLKRFEKDIKCEGYAQPDYYIKRELGGLGAICLENEEVKLNKKNRMMATLWIKTNRPWEIKRYQFDRDTVNFHPSEKVVDRCNTFIDKMNNKKCSRKDYFRKIIPAIDNYISRIPVTDKILERMEGFSLPKTFRKLMERKEFWIDPGSFQHADDIEMNSEEDIVDTWNNIKKANWTWHRYQNDGAVDFSDIGDSLYAASQIRLHAQRVVNIPTWWELSSVGNVMKRDTIRFLAKRTLGSISAFRRISGITF